MNQKIYGIPVATPIDPDVVKTGLLIVTYDDEVEPWTASHSASEILAHLDKGGSVILQFPGNRFGHGYAQLHSVAFGNVVFCEVNMSVTPEILMYTVGDTKEVTVEVFTMNGGTVQEEKGVKSYTVTRAGQTITMVLTLDDDTTETHVLALDENDYPTSITVNGKTITGEWSGF